MATEMWACQIPTSNGTLFGLAAINHFVLLMSIKIRIEGEKKSGNGVLKKSRRGREDIIYNQTDRFKPIMYCCTVHSNPNSLYAISIR